MLTPSQIAANSFRVLDQISEAATLAGREPSSIRLVAVTKMFPPDVVRVAYAAGLRDFGENRVQEFVQKFAQLSLPEARFHLIGHLQSNKASHALPFDWIQTVDSARLARRLDQAAAQAGKKLPILLQVKLGEEASKTGAAPETLTELAATVNQLDNLLPRGLMTIPPYTGDPEAGRPFFRRLRQLRDQLQSDGFAQLRELSMGMTHDFPVAIAEGATMVRIGSAIFGPRPVPGTKLAPQ
jgi:pyridoxal phosphate enzyme (YggS family)